MRACVRVCVCVCVCVCARVCVSRTHTLNQPAIGFTLLLGCVAWAVSHPPISAEQIQAMMIRPGDEEGLVMIDDDLGTSGGDAFPALPAAQQVVPPSLLSSPPLPPPSTCGLLCGVCVCVCVCARA